MLTDFLFQHISRKRCWVLNLTFYNTHFYLHIFFSILVKSKYRFLYFSKTFHIEWRTLYQKRSSLSRIESNDVRNIVLKGSRISWFMLFRFPFFQIYHKHKPEATSAGTLRDIFYWDMREEFFLWQICLLGQVGCQVTQEIR